MKHILTAIFLVLGISTSLSDQGGSFLLSDLNDLLSQQTILWQRVETAFDIYPAGDANRIGWAENHELDGTRIGPYKLYAKPKESAGPFVYQIIIETKALFYDRAARIVPRGKAVSVRQELVAIKVVPLAPRDYFSPTSD